MKIVSWNVEVNRSDDEVKKALKNLISDHGPNVICLQEAKQNVDMLKNHFGHDNGGDWWVYAHGEWDESNNCPVMVRDNYSKKSRGDGWDTLRTTTTWEGPNGNKHKGRTWTYVLVDGIWIMSYHRCTGGKSKNKSASQEERRVTVDWINQRDSGPVLVFGDHNYNPKEQDPGWSSWNIANDVSGSVRYDKDEVTVDFAICRNLKAQTVERVGSYGSDHHAVKFVTE